LPLELTPYLGDTPKLSLPPAVNAYEMTNARADTMTTARAARLLIPKAAVEAKSDAQ
jgi:hypothetical protein